MKKGTTPSPKNSANSFPPQGIKPGPRNSLPLRSPRATEEAELNSLSSLRRLVEEQIPRQLPAVRGPFMSTWVPPEEQRLAMMCRALAAPKAASATATPCRQIAIQRRDKVIRRPFPAGVKAISSLDRDVIPARIDVLNVTNGGRNVQHATASPYLAPMLQKTHVLKRMPKQPTSL
jgi:hypothetical protein